MGGETHGFWSMAGRLGLLRTLALVFRAGFEYLLVSQHHVLVVR